MKLKLIIIGLLLLLLSVHIASANPYTIDGSKVYIDDEKAYISAVPHTLEKSGYVYFNIVSKVYTGNVDLAFGFSSDKMKPTHAAYLSGDGVWVPIASLFNKESHLYDGLDTWYIATDLPIIEDNSYMIRVWVDLLTWNIHDEKYGFAIKPSSQTLPQAITAGNLFYLDPWGNASSTPDVIAPTNNLIYTKDNPTIINLNASSGSWPGEDIQYFYYGDTGIGTTLLGNSSADNSTTNFTWYVYSSGDYNWKVRAWNGSVWSEYSATQSFTAVIPPVSTTNLLNNSDFEVWSAGPTSNPDNWSNAGAGSTIARSDVTVNGSYSVALTRDGASTYIYQDIPISGYPGRTISVGGWILDSNAANSRILIYKGGGGSAATDFSGGSGGWEWIELTVPLEPTTTVLRTQIYNQWVDSTVYFDDFILVEGLETAILPYPANVSTINVSYPPLDDEVDFDWQDTGADQYRLVVARDVNFNLISADIHTSDSEYSYSLQADTYYWKVYGYDGTTYSDASATWSFTIDSTADVTGSAVHGTIYSAEGYLSNSEVILSNSSEGIIETQLTGSNGYYLFESLDPDTVYTITVNRDLYISTTANFNASSNPIVKDFYLLPDRTSEEWRHYVTFTVWGLSGYYSDVEVNVYEGDSVTALCTEATGSDGAVTFIMNRQTEYRVTFINATQGINKEMTLYPSDDSYLIFIAFTNPWDEYSTPQSSAIGASVSTEIINSSAAYVNLTWSDTLAQTTSATVYLNQTNSSDRFNQTVLDSESGLSGNFTSSFIVTNYSGENYYVHVIATHTTYGTIDKTFSASFDDDLVFDGIPDKFLLYIAMFIMLFTAAMFGAANATQGSMVWLSEGWIFLSLGWFSSINSTIVGTGLAFATVFAIVAIISNKNKKEGIE